MSFELTATCPRTGARAGIITTPHGQVPTPAFMPVGTQASVKALTPDDVLNLGAKMVLGNTYHLYLRPGMDVIEKFGGLHRFMGWNGPILTDSGGYQVFSLGHLRQVSDAGVRFRSHHDGSEHFVTPEMVIRCQETLEADIMMPLDECPPYTDDQNLVREAVERTSRWAERCLHSRQNPDQIIYGIVQGGAFTELRQKSAAAITSMGFDGYAVGGMSIGEPKSVTYDVIEQTAAMLPASKPRYLMGVGSPEDLVTCIGQGIDLFDSALPTRIARNGGIFTRQGRIIIRNQRFKQSDAPLDEGCDCYTCRHFSIAYLNHLFRCKELLAYRLATLHNLRFVLRLVSEIRRSIIDGSFASFRDGFLDMYKATDESVRLAQREKSKKWANTTNWSEQ